MNTPKSSSTPYRSCKFLLDSSHGKLFKTVYFWPGYPKEIKASSLYWFVCKTTSISKRRRRRRSNRRDSICGIGFEEPLAGCIGRGSRPYTHTVCAWWDRDAMGFSDRPRCQLRYTTGIDWSTDPSHRCYLPSSLPEDGPSSFDRFHTTDSPLRKRGGNSTIWYCGLVRN